MNVLKLFSKARHSPIWTVPRRSSYTEVTKIDDYLKKVNSGKLVVAQFGASWCAPCKKMKPIIKKLGEDNDNIESLYIDIDELPELGENEDINELPTILLRKNGKYLDKIVGMKFLVIYLPPDCACTIVSPSNVLI
ncbi:thioredoxin-like protein 2, putative [Plasmodium ovale]|uniref:Thioredoxin-like protein 2, putative n=1 Tax=Plasmodium ovale TaxID=36330 RepID=A0A1D3U7Y6_PLAOA|nr:thioredoxin-like protein 2, putative [Plasmodium ovale]